MRLLKTQDSDSASWQPQLIEARDEKYAILSHCWLADANDEVLFADIHIIHDGGKMNPEDKNDPRRQSKYKYNSNFSHRSVFDVQGYDKLRGAARQAAREGYSFIWVDTCCIDKSSSAELSEAINSMYKWYHDSEICFAYLADVSDGPARPEIPLGSNFASSKWWTRGWTLQELVAPPHVVFYTQGWKPLGEKRFLGSVIYAISGIGIDVLRHPSVLKQTSIARRMNWASLRKTTRPEDRAYSLMGIFGVNMPLLYGEGDKAFLRLQEEIIKNSDDESIFAWVDPDAQDDQLYGLLARSPSHFSKSREVIYYQDFEDREPYVMSNRGLSIPLHLSRCKDGTFAAALHCPVAHTGDGFLAVFLQRRENTQQFARVKCRKLGSLQTRGALEMIYVVQENTNLQQNRVLPYHFFNLRHLFSRCGMESLPPSSEACEPFRVTLSAIAKAASYDAGSVSEPFPTSYAKGWIRTFPGCFRVIRGEEKLSVALFFKRASDGTEIENTECIVVMLGSISNTEIGFDAYEGNDLPEFRSMEKTFQPRPGGQWKRLLNVDVKIEFEPQVSGSSQLFLTDITILDTTRPPPFDAVLQRVANAALPNLNTGSANTKRGWQRLLRTR